MFFVVFASTAVVPGPNAAYSVAQSMQFGVRQALPVAIGFACGTAGHAVLVFSGIGLLASEFPAVLRVLQWAGVLFLVYLAFKAMTASTRQTAGRAQQARPLDLILGAILVAFTNPKGLLASLLIYPAFVDPTLPFLTQAIAYGATGAAISFTVYAAYIAIAGSATALFQNKATLGKVVGIVYLCVAAALALRG